MKLRSMSGVLAGLSILCVGGMVRGQTPPTAPSASAPTSRPTVSYLAQQTPKTPAGRALLGWLNDPKGELKATPFGQRPIDRDEAADCRALLWAAYRDQIAKQVDLSKGEVTVNFRGSPITMKIAARKFGEKPDGGYSLFISMHGGGNAPANVNDQQWQNQIRLYEPKDSIYVAPRAPTNTWNLWHEEHMDDLFDKLISAMVATRDVNPDKVYLMGYSAGGDGVYQLAPRMADRFAAASMMAGHPNDAVPDALRNLPFAIHVGANDGGFKRNEVAAEWGKKLDALAAADGEGGYVHFVKIHQGRGHWMNREDAEAVPWMQQYTREALPKKVVWRQGHRVHDRFYWLAVPSEAKAKKGDLVVASRAGQVITIEKAEGVESVTVMLNDRMVDLDEVVTVRYGERELFKGRLKRTMLTAQQTLAGRGDPRLVFDASVTVRIPAAGGATPPASSDAATTGKALAYLKQNLPPGDKQLPESYLESNAAAAVAAWKGAPWAGQVPEEVFLEAVLPYASIDETREDWRPTLAPLARELVAGETTIEGAVKKLNSTLFARLGFNYHATNRLMPNQNVSESVACGSASCSGLSIALINACRAVGIPARFVGVASWVAPAGPTYQLGGGNHSWVEIWDGRQWRFVGAAEPGELDKTWFVEAAGRCREDAPVHALWASAWAKTGTPFTLLWDPENKTVPAVNVTAFYSKRKTVKVEGKGNITVRLDGQLVAAGAPGEFILAGGKTYQVTDDSGQRDLKVE